jgi:hypothetical protein
MQLATPALHHPTPHHPTPSTPGMSDMGLLKHVQGVMAWAARDRGDNMGWGGGMEDRGFPPGQDGAPQPPPLPAPVTP